MCMVVMMKRGFNHSISPRNIFLSLEQDRTENIKLYLNINDNIKRLK